MGLSSEGIRDAHFIAQSLDVSGFEQIVTSPSRRSRFLASLISRKSRLPYKVEARLMERDFGWWESRCWDDVWQTVGSDMDGMLDFPRTYRPGGGETTEELGSRVYDWFTDLPSHTFIIAVLHGGPIGALVGRLLELAPPQWLNKIPSQGEGVLIQLDEHSLEISVYETLAPVGS